MIYQNYQQKVIIVQLDQYFDPSSDLKLLTSGDLDKNIRMWDTKNSSCKGEPQ